MNIQLARRIRSAEKTVTALAPPTRPTKRMFYPVDGDEQDVERYHAEVEQAVREGFFVICLVPLLPLTPATSEGAKA